MPLPEITLAETNYGRVLEAVKLTIAELALPGMPGESIVISKVGWIDPETDTFPRIVIDPRPEIANPDSGTNERDDTVYNVMVAMVFAGGLDDTSRNLGLHLYWRQKVWRTLRNKKPDTYSNLSLESGSSLLRVWVEPGDVFIDAAKRAQLNAQYVLGRFLVREPRT